MPERGGASAGCGDFAVFLDHHPAELEVDFARPARGRSQGDDAARCVVRDRIDDADLPVLDAGVDNLEARKHPVRRGQDIGDRDALADQIAPEEKSNLAFRSRLNQPGHRYGLARIVEHAGKQQSEVRLVDVEEVLHGLRRRADLLADDPFA